MLTKLRQTGRLLVDGLRAAVLLRPRAAAFEAGLPACVIMALMTMGSTALFEFVLSNGSASFNPQGMVLHTVTLAAVVALVGLAPVGWTGAAQARMAQATLALAVVLPLVADAIMAGLRALMPRLGPALTEPQLADWAPVALAGVFLVALLRVGFGLAERWRVAAGMLLAAAVCVGVMLFPSAPIFLSRETAMGDFSLLQSAIEIVQPKAQETAEDEPPRPRIDAETAMMRQGSLLAAALADLKPPRPERAEFYFVGFAPYAAQDVFKREVSAVRQLFDERFGTAGRSLVLVNHRETVGGQPLASMSNLGAALEHIGRLMRPERDVLVLFVTSHGNKGQIAVYFPGFPLNTMTPERLAGALDRAGIVNRVLVLSACHAGSFVERLRTDSSLILAAADAEKTSFGCSNENEWTYFGDAYFNHALRTETSLIDAFEPARKLIEAWEKKDNLDPSEPQIFVGPGIKAKLDAVPVAAR